MTDRGGSDGLPYVSRLVPADGAALHALRLDALRGHPEAFGSSVAEELPGLPAWLAAHLDEGRIYGAWGGDGLAGMAGLWLEEAEKRRHRGGLWGMYVRPAWRGRGVGRMLVRHALDRAAEAGLEQVHLGVGAGNRGAQALYASCGFEVYGTEPRSLKIGAAYVDELLMVCRLRP